MPPRPDDNIDSIMKRFHIFREQTTPVIAKYRTLGKVVDINAEKGLDAVRQELARIFNTHFPK